MAVTLKQARRQQWGSARSRLTETAKPHVIDQMIIWRIDDPRYTDHTNLVKGKIMQRQWTIEGRADFADTEKNDAITTAFRNAAVMLNATLALIKDNGIAPQVVCYSDDFFTGHEDIALMEDKLGKAIAFDSGGDGVSVSDEMMQAMRDMQHDKAG